MSGVMDGIDRNKPGSGWEVRFVMVALVIYIYFLTISHLYCCANHGSFTVVGVLLRLHRSGCGNYNNI